MRLRIVGAVALHRNGTLAGATSLPFDRLQRCEQRQQLNDVIAVSPGDHNAQRHARSVGQKMVLGAGFAAVYRTWACFSRADRAPQKNRPLPPTSPERLALATLPKGAGATSPTRPLLASRASAANRSCWSRIPTLVANTPRGCRFSRQIKCRSALGDCYGLAAWILFATWFERRQHGLDKLPQFFL